jgi:hypothetical protein
MQVGGRIQYSVTILGPSGKLHSGGTGEGSSKRLLPFQFLPPRREALRSSVKTCKISTLLGRQLCELRFTELRVESQTPFLHKLQIRRYL